MTTSIAFNSDTKARQPLYTNKWYVLFVCLITSINTLLLMVPGQFADLFSVEHIPDWYRLKLGLTILVNTALTLGN